MGRQQVAIQWLRLRGEEKKIQVFLCVRIHDTRGFDAERNVLRRKVETHVEQAPEY